MSYGRILKPRIYACRAAHAVLRGTAPSSVVSIQANGVSTGSNITDLVAMHPQATTSIDTDAESTDAIISFDLQQESDVNFLAILNHNLYTAGAKIVVYHHTAAITAINIGSATTVTTTAQVGSMSSGTFSANGSHVMTFTSAFKRYWAITLQEVGATFTADAIMGSVMLGTYWDAPYAPDLQVARAVVHDGLKIEETRGGKRYGSVGWVTGSEGNSLPYGAPFRTEGLDTSLHHFSGRREYGMTFSRIADTSLDQSDWSQGHMGDGTGTCKWRDIISLMGGGTLPCIFTVDGTSTTAGDYMFARVTAEGEKQVAPHVWTVSATISEEF